MLSITRTKQHVSVHLLRFLEFRKSRESKRQAKRKLECNVISHQRLDISLLETALQEGIRYDVNTSRFDSLVIIISVSALP
jgi:hypothetical protein